MIKIKRQSISADRLRLFAVQGNIAHGKVRPWEIFRGERWVSRDIESER